MGKECSGWERWQRGDMIKVYKIKKEKEMVNREELFFFIVILYSCTRPKNWHDEAADLEQEKSLIWMLVVKVEKVSQRKFHKWWLNLVKSGNGKTGDSWAVGGCTVETSLQPCLVLHFSQVFVAGCLFRGRWTLLWPSKAVMFCHSSCYLTGRVLPGVIQHRIVQQLCLLSLPHPAWTAEQHRDITARALNTWSCLV